MLSKITSYQFSEFVLDVGERCLKKGSQQIYLPPKTFATLLYLIERPGRLVKKEELLDNLWPDAEVTENALTRCIKEVREALQDDVHDPRYIKTIPRVGYKFIAEVEPVREATPVTVVAEELTATRVEITDEVNGNLPSPLDLQTPPAEPSVLALPAAPEGRLDRPRWKGAVGIALTVFAVLAGAWYYSHARKPSLGFAERDWVLIADFENFTGEKVFDAALRTALERELSRSRYVNFVPQGRVFDTFGLMKRSPDTRINESVGREICLRDGSIRALLAGSIQQIGGVYAINLKVVDPKTGVAVNSLAEEAANLQGVLPAIRRLAVTLRETLGESLASISKSDQQLERVTTPSLEALEAYSKGLRLNEQVQWPQALVFLDQAVERDPNFAMAHWARGWTHHWTRRPFVADFNRAAELVGGVTDREKYTILGTQALYCFGDLPRAIEIQERLLQLYPDDYHANQTVGRLYLALGDMSRWRECSKKSERIRPNFTGNHFENALVALFSESDVERYYSESMQVLALNPNYPGGGPHVADPVRDWMRGDVAQAQEKISKFRAGEMASALGPAFQISVRPFLARFYLFIGKPEVALELLETTRGMAPLNATVDFSKYWQLERALIYREQGNAREFERLAGSAASEGVGISRVEALGWLAIASAQSGRSKQAFAFRDQLLKEDRLPPIGFFSPPLPRELERAKRAFSLQIEGEIALKEGNLDQAISRFKGVIDLVPPQGAFFTTNLQPQLFFVANQSLAKAFEKRGEWRDAGKAYEAILAQKVQTIGVPGAAQIWVQALNSASEALEKAGETARAGAYHEQYRQLRPGKG
ncbi:MAG: winged helix-turn-helix domain-containing protein [Terriglobia bacterium]